MYLRFLLGELELLLLVVVSFIEPEFMSLVLLLDELPFVSLVAFELDFLLVSSSELEFVLLFEVVRVATKTKKCK